MRMKLTAVAAANKQESDEEDGRKGGKA